MNKDIAKGKWTEIRGAIKEQWGDLTDDDLVEIEGKMEKLAGILQTKYGYTKEKAEQAYKAVIEKHIVK